MRRPRVEGNTISLNRQPTRFKFTSCVKFLCFVSYFHAFAADVGVLLPLSAQVLSATRSGELAIANLLASALGGQSSQGAQIAAYTMPLPQGLQGGWFVGDI